MSDPASSELCAVVVHWNDEEGLGALLDAWPDFHRFPLVVVDNSKSLDPASLPADVLYEDPGRNLGFGGGADRGVQALAERHSDWRWVLILNPDAAPEPGAVEALLEACRHWRSLDPDLAGVAPRLLDEDGSTQHRWQLQPLPRPWTLLAQVFFLAGLRGPREPPVDGAVIEQPAAAVLALHRSARDERGCFFDEAYFPAWFDDVDLAKRLHTSGRRLRYSHAASFRHARGSSVPTLGYGRFLWIYLRNLERYLRKHHGSLWAILARLALPVSMLLRLLALPLRRPTRARGRAQAARGLLAVLTGALTGWRQPRPWARQFRLPAEHRSGDG